MMLTAAFWTLASAVAFGSAAALVGLRKGAAGITSWPLGAVHGTLAVIGFGLLVWALPGSTRGMGTGSSSFGVVAAVLIALALLLGLVILSMRFLKKRLSGTLIGIHATLAVSGFVILAAYLFSG
jgi:hypothetical protein